MSITIRAKFKCNSITDYGATKQAAFSAVYSQEGENADFTKYTPYGELKVNFDSEGAAAEAFKPGKSYYLDFSEAPEA